VYIDLYIQICMQILDMHCTERVQQTAVGAISIDQGGG
jgi:hypothetical protein